MVPQARLELARLSALVSKTSVSTIPPYPHILYSERESNPHPEGRDFKSLVSTIPPPKHFGGLPPLVLSVVFPTLMVGISISVTTFIGWTNWTPKYFFSNSHFIHSTVICVFNHFMFSHSLSVKHSSFT